MSWLLDTNILSEFRKGTRGHPRVIAWWGGVPAEHLFLSALTLGEVRKGAESLRRRDPPRAAAFENWLTDVEEAFTDRVLPVDTAVADAWGRIAAIRTVPTVDALLAATARVHGLTLVTRDADLRDLGVPVLNPFEA